jgi:hypothetical protein
MTDVFSTNVLKRPDKASGILIKEQMMRGYSILKLEKRKYDCCQRETDNGLTEEEERSQA